MIRTPKQQRFVDEYLVDLNATQAAIRAGYSKRTAGAIGEQLVRKLAAEITQAKQERSERTQIDADWVLRRLHTEATADLARIFDDRGVLRPIADWPAVWRTGLVVGVETFEEFEGKGPERIATGVVRKVKLSDRIRHVELIGKHVTVAAFREQLGLGGPTGGPLQHEHRKHAMSDDELADIAAAGRG